jgi:hypothetical protein
MTDLLSDASAAQLVADLMPIAIVVGGDQAASLAASLETAGAAAETLTAETEGAYDLAVLRAEADGFATGPVQALIARLVGLSDRIVFVPSAAVAQVDALTPWFEHFAELGFQPVVEYDAGYLADGAFLVDRNATAAETDLAGFTERLSLGGALHASTVRVAELEAQLGEAAALRAELDAARGAAAEAASLRALLKQAETRMTAMADDAAIWAPLQRWVREAVADPARDAAPATVPQARKRGLLGLFRRKPAPTTPDDGLRHAALVRRCKLFDAAWYIACHPELAETGQDPVLHYLRVGAAQGFDPGPWFDTTAYLRRNAGLDPAHTPPLLHAIETGQADALLARAG